MLTLTKRARDIRVRRHRAKRRCRRSIAASRRRSSSSPICRPTTCVFSPPTTAIRSIAGRRCRRSRPGCWSTTWRRSAPAPARARGRRPARRARRDPRRRDARAGLRRARAHAAGRGRHRPRDRPRRRSRRDLRGAHGAARGDRRAPGGRAHANAIGSLPTRGPYRPDAASAGRRALRNVCLDLLVAAQRPDAIALAARQYATADNMTDRMAALATLSQHDVPERSRRARRFLPPLRRRSADHRQMVRAAGRRSRKPRRSTASRRSPRIRHSRSPIPTACAR